MNKGGFISLVVIGVVVGTFAIGAGVTAGTYNGAIQREETVTAYKAHLSNTISDAVGELTNLANVVNTSSENYNKIIEAITAARNAKSETASTESIDAAITAINVVHEAYPDWNQSDIYREQMYAIDKTYQRVENQKESYNTAVKDYRTYVKKFPNSMLLSFAGYDAKEISYIGKDVSNIDDSWGF